ncbi:MAG: (5-formylfuran-3-yl)methyl phosphate synthase [Candidatus Methanoperedens sp.]|nr:(5-formylfuran-3-yl)methyl phosphate synthase [Candidatus Methanoperedens sp.]MCE8426361.1 (5-formylfuran-3-yl)methyl phosphate synthase [Candidatus Methanoperedens sp.]MCE8428993.1 (5-formylfuran-3-yl)methyl phosphate synthase [Candidatus Methanoperedens sp.]
MKLLVSPINVEEAKISKLGGADIIDVKNPKEGSLGANFPWMIKAVKNAAGCIPVSATIGDFNYKPGTASLAALGAAAAGADYIKVGLYDIQTKEQALDMLVNIVRSVKDYDRNKKVVASGYSDYRRINSISPFELPAIGALAGVDVVMMDTGIKDGRSTFEFLNGEELTEFVNSAKDHGLKTALAGTIKFEDIPALKRISPDIIGVRGCVCGGDRKSVIRKELVERLKDMI